MIFETGLVTMINLRGRLCYVASSEVSTRKSQGWQIIVNPRREYYPEWDQDNKNQMSRRGEINEDEDSKNYLKYEDI